MGAGAVEGSARPTGGVGRGVTSSRVLTVPNALSLLRLVGVPLFLWLVLVDESTARDGLAILLLMASGITDWLDGWLARSLGQTSRVGQLLDPLVDRLYVVSTLIALAVRDVIPGWLVVVLLGRDAALTALLPVLRAHGHGPLPVHFLGKLATFSLMFALPGVLIGVGDGVVADLLRPLAWAFLIWGSVLYLWAGVLYAVQVRQLVRARA